jgi:hypothetical protein
MKTSTSHKDYVTPPPYRFAPTLRLTMAIPVGAVLGLTLGTGVVKALVDFFTLVS